MPITRHFEFDVNTQMIKPSNVELWRDLLVAGSAEIYQAEFNFSAEWDGFAKIAVFECGGERREAVIASGVCAVPWEILQPNAFLKVGVYGVYGDAVMPTVYTTPMRISPGAEPSEEAREHSADVFDQIAEIGEQAAQSASDAAQSASEAAEAESNIANMTVDAETLPPSSEAEVTKSGGGDEPYYLHFGIPKGAKGDTGEQGERGFSGVYVGAGEMPEGYNVQIDINADPVVPALPGVSAADNGKILRVVNGTWAAAEDALYEGEVE